MKMKTIRHLFILFFVVLCHVACQENYYIENELHGLWQVTRVEDKTTGESTEAQGELYYSFQRNMVILGYNAPDKPTGLMMTQYASEFYLNSDSLEIGDFRIYLGEQFRICLGSLFNRFLSLLKSDQLVKPLRRRLQQRY